jgi:hypothetical protein
MNLQAVLSKTAKGADEIATRKYKLEQRLRSLLIVVNGKATAGELVDMFAQAGDITPRLEKLIADGFIAEAASAAASSPAGFEDARGALSRALSDAIGPAGDAICIKIEECGSVQELKDFLASRRDMLDAGLGRKSAAFWAKAKELLG